MAPLLALNNTETLEKSNEVTKGGSLEWEGTTTSNDEGKKLVVNEGIAL